MMYFLLVVVDILLIKAFLGDLIGFLMGVGVAFALNWVIMFTQQGIVESETCPKKAKR